MVNKRALVILGLMLSLLALSVCTSWAVGIKDIQNQKDLIDGKLNQLNKDKQKEEKKLDNAVGAKTQLQNQKEKEIAEYKKLLSDVKKYEKDLRTIDDSLNDAEKKYSEQKELLKKRLRTMYENSNTTYIQTIAESKSIIDFMERFELISIISSRDKELVESINDTKEDIEYKKKKKEMKKKETQTKVSNKITSIDKLDQSKSNLEKQISDINSKLKEIENQEDELNKKSEEISNYIKNLKSKNAKYSGGSMVWPVPSSSLITSYFGYRIHPILKTSRYHSGIDIAAAEGNSVICANKGTIVIAGWQGGYGNAIVVDHGGGVFTLYGHLSKILVNEGDVVDARATIGKIGSTGVSTGPHLHFEVKNNGATVDPLKYVSP